MKRVMAIPAGAADEPLEGLNGQTPLAVAHTPNMDWISMNGRQGRVVTIPEGSPPGSEVGMLSLLGYDTAVEAVGYGPLEAVARGLSVRPDQLVFCCNFVTVTDGMMEDFTAGHISQAEADRLIADLNEYVADERCHFYSCGSYRALMVVSDVADMSPDCTPPHDIPGKPVGTHGPRGSGSKWAKEIMERARQVLAGHDVNLVRSDLGENPATDIWLWGQGRPRRLETFARRFGVSAVAVASTDLVRGLARSVGMDVRPVQQVTAGTADPYTARSVKSVSAIDTYDLVIVHIETPDEAGHRGDAGAKITALENIDEHILGPVLEKLRAHDDWKILVAPDHPTPIERRVHTATPSPFCMAGRRIQTVLNRPFSEATAATSDLQIDPGYELMEFFLKS